VELSREPYALSDLVGIPVENASGRRLGRVWEARAHWERDGTIAIDELLVGRGALLKRLRGPGANARSIPWESVAEIEAQRIVVRG
jgi:sporulation protein YlmC with PRC-barrel domain